MPQINIRDKGPTFINTRLAAPDLFNCVIDYLQTTMPEKDNCICIGDFQLLGFKHADDHSMPNDGRYQDCFTRVSGIVEATKSGIYM